MFSPELRQFGSRLLVHSPEFCIPLHLFVEAQRLLLQKCALRLQLCQHAMATIKVAWVSGELGHWGMNFGSIPESAEDARAPGGGWPCRIMSL